MAQQTDDLKLAEQLVKQDVITRQELDEAKEREAVSGTPWYRQLLQMKKMSFPLVEDLLRYEFHPKSLRKQHETLGQTLVRMNGITEKQLDDALAEQNRNGRLLGNILREGGHVSRQTIDLALSKQYGLEYAELAKTPSEPAALECVSESMARKNRMLPVRLEGDKVTVLITHPGMTASLRDAGVMLGKRIYPILTTSDDIRSEITKRYRKARLGIVSTPKTTSKSPPKPQEPSARDSRETVEMARQYQTTSADTSTNSGSNLEEIARQASGVPVIKLVTTIIEGAANSGATDIHLDPQEPEMRVRYRIDGLLHDVMSIPPETESAVVSRVKIMSNMDITETRRPQDGHISMDIGPMEYDMRVATLPTFLGERVVIRLLDQSSVMSGIKDLGLEAEDQKKLSRMINQAYGMILVTGPTGSGKTTTLYATLNQKNVMTDSIVTLEDPVEYQLSGINQVQIDTDIELTFANTLRASLRQDIDVLLVGEIRDPDTARIAIRAAMTGHLVFSTLHTNDAAEAISTLRNMGIPSYLIASALSGVIGQRLVRKICPKCKTAYSPQKPFLKSMGLPESTRKLYRGKGCENCYHTGSKGRTGIFEILEVTPEVRKLIASDSPIQQISKAAKLKTMAERCKAKVKKGLIPAEEFLRVIRV